MCHSLRFAWLMKQAGVDAVPHVRIGFELLHRVIDGELNGKEGQLNCRRLLTRQSWEASPCLLGFVGGTNKEYM